MRRSVMIVLLVITPILLNAFQGTLYINTYDNIMAVKTEKETLWVKVRIPKPIKPCQSVIDYLYTPPKIFHPDLEYVNQSMMVLKNGIVLGKNEGDVILEESFDLLEDLYRSGKIKDVIIGHWPLQLLQNRLIVNGSVDGASVAQYLSLFDMKSWEFSVKRFDLISENRTPPFEFDLTPRPPTLKMEVYGGYDGFPALVNLKPEDNGDIVEATLTATPSIRITSLSSFTYLIEPHSTGTFELFSAVYDGFGYEASISTNINFPPPPRLIVENKSMSIDLDGDTTRNLKGQLIGPGPSWPGTSVVVDVDLSGTDVIIKRTVLKVVDRTPPKLGIDLMIKDRTLNASITARDEINAKIRAWIDGVKIAILDKKLRFTLENGTHLLLIEAVDGNGNASRWSKIINVWERPRFNVFSTRVGWLLWRDPSTSTGWNIGDQKIIEQNVLLVHSDLPVYLITSDGRKIRVEPP